jgi:hypothetical protein
VLAEKSVAYLIDIFSKKGTTLPEVVPKRRDPPETRQNIRTRWSKLKLYIDNYLVVGFGESVWTKTRPISWKSKGQTSVTLSSSEAEFVALTEDAKEIKFIVQILQSMGIPVKLPVICRVDNVGSTFMAKNINTTSKLKHVDLKLRWLTELVVDEKLLKIVFVKSEENVSDWFTKTVNED